jgi:hypothetical protein
MTSDFDLGPAARSTEELIDLCQIAINTSIRKGHPAIFRSHLLDRGVDPYVLGGTWLSEALNTNQ